MTEFILERKYSKISREEFESICVSDLLLSPAGDHCVICALTGLPELYQGKGLVSLVNEKQKIGYIELKENGFISISDIPEYVLEFLAMRLDASVYSVDYSGAGRTKPVLTFEID